MSDFIKRSDAVEYVMSILDVNKYYHPHSKSRNVPIDEVVDRINQVPTADAIQELIGTAKDLQAIRERLEEENDALRLEPKLGEWIPIQIGKWRGHKCSCCGIAREVPCSSSDWIPQWKYCPECGARMEVQE